MRGRQGKKFASASTNTSAARSDATEHEQCADILS